MKKIERKYMAHFLQVGEEFVRLGQDLEEYSPELSAQVEKTQNILGHTAVRIAGYEKSGAVEPYFAVAGDPLFEKLQAIIDGGLVLEDANPEGHGAIVGQTLDIPVIIGATHATEILKSGAVVTVTSSEALNLTADDASDPIITLTLVKIG